MLSRLTSFTALTRSLSTLNGARSLHSLPSLPYNVSKGLAPAISAEALDLHYNKHHKTYVDKTNAMIAGACMWYMFSFLKL